MSDDPATARTPTVAVPVLWFRFGVALLVVLIGLQIHQFQEFGRFQPLTTPKTARRHVPLEPVRTTLLHGEALLAALRAGGKVVYVRHFQTDHRKWEEDPIKPLHLEMRTEDFLDCENQRMLSDYGRRRAEDIGEAIRRLGIPTGTVYSSPYCRATEGAERMFGKKPDVVEKGFIYRGGDYTRAMMTDFVRPYLGKKPAPGTNSWIMAHRPQMDDLGEIEEGDMFVFEPLGESGFALIAKIKHHEWYESAQDMALLGLWGFQEPLVSPPKELQAEPSGAGV